MRPVTVNGWLCPGAAAVADFDAHVFLDVDCDGHGESPASTAGLAVQGGVGGHLGRAKDGVSGESAAVQ